MADRIVFDTEEPRGENHGVFCSGINYESVVDGDGIRIVVFISGCRHCCPGCHNPATHDFKYGVPFDDDLQTEIIRRLNTTPYLSGLTISGGDPMFSAKKLIPFCERVRKEVIRSRSNNIWIYSGFTREEIAENADMEKLLSLCDVLVDGKFIMERRDPLL